MTWENMQYTGDSKSLLPELLYKPRENARVPVHYGYTVTVHGIVNLLWYIIMYYFLPTQKFQFHFEYFLTSRLVQSLLSLWMTGPGDPFGVNLKPDGTIDFLITRKI